MPLIVRVLPVATAMVPPKALMAMVLEIVAVVVTSNIPVAAMVTVPVGRLLPLLPPEVTDTIPPPKVVPPL